MKENIMKLKYKKIILVISMSTMAIGLVTLSIMKPSVKTSSGTEEVANLKVTKEVTSTAKDTKDLAKDNVTDSTKPTSSEASTANTGDKNKLQKDTFPKINELVQNYLSALVKCDMDTLSKYVTDTDTIDLKTLQKQSEYIEDYKNIECYTLNGKVEGSYIVYVYEELKIIGIDTLAPGMIRLYITTTEDGKLYIASGTTDDDTSNYINSTSKNEEVIELIKSVNLKLTEAQASDADLKKFINNISEITEKAETAISESEKAETGISESEKAN